MTALHHPPLRWLTLAALCGLAACGAPAGQDLFPLQAGAEWHYRVLTQLEDGEPDEDTLVLRALGKETLADGSSAWHRRSDDGMDWWLRSDDTGIYRVASKSDSDPEPTPDGARRYVLKLPYQVGTEWRATTAAYLLQRPQQFPRELRSTHRDIPMVYVLEGLDDVVKTPAGEFAHCLRVAGRAELRLYLDPVAGWGDLPLKTTEWYCPGPGLVKILREERGHKAFLIGGTVLMELTEWRPS